MNTTLYTFTSWSDAFQQVTACNISVNAQMNYRYQIALINVTTKISFDLSLLPAGQSHAYAYNYKIFNIQKKFYSYPARKFNKINLKLRKKANKESKHFK